MAAIRVRCALGDVGGEAALPRCAPED
jgi:hypothetical protein